MTDSEQYGSRDNSERSGGDRRRGSGGPGGWNNRGDRDRSWQDRGGSRDRRDDRREGGRNDRRDDTRGGDRRDDRRSFDGRRDDRGGDRRDFRRDDRRDDRAGDRRDDRRRDNQGGDDRREPRRWDDRPRNDRSDGRSGDRKGQSRQFDRFQDRKDGHRSERRSGDWERKRETGNRSRTWEDRSGSGDRRDDRGGSGDRRDDRRSFDGPRDDRGGDRRDFRRDDRTNDRRDDRGGRSDGRRTEGYGGGDRRENRRWDDRPRNDRNDRRSYGDRTDDRRNDRGGRSDDRRSFDGRRDDRGGDRRDVRRDDRGGRPDGRKDFRRDDRRSGEGRRDDRGGDRRDDRGGRPDGRKDFRRDDRSGGRRDDRRRDNFGGDDRRRDADREERMTRRDLNDLDKPRFIAPDIDEDVTGREVDKPTRRQLEALEPRNAERVAQHLVMAARYLEVDPEFALEHANAAVRKAGRIAVVREATGVAAYAAEDYALALKELRTHRRISGSEEHLPLIVDCQRALGKAEKALEEAQSSAVEKLDAAGKVELAIVVSGIHSDAGDKQASLAALQIPQLDKNRGFSYSPRLFRAYAEALRGVGRDKEALSWERQAIVAEAALGLGQFSEPEIVDLGDDIDLDAAKETVREAGERHSENVGDVAETPHESANATDSGVGSPDAADDAPVSNAVDGQDDVVVTEASTPVEAEVSADSAQRADDEAGDNTDTSVAAPSETDAAAEPAETTAPVEPGESHTVAPASESGETDETGDDSENHDR